MSDVTIREKLAALEKVKEIATLAGFGGKINEERLRFETGLSLPNDRSQGIFINIPQRRFNDHIAITIGSPCLIVEKGFLKGIGKAQALDLLARNENLPFARFGIWTGETEDMIVVSADYLLDTLDPEEFDTYATFVALIADSYEQEHGQDVF